MPPQTAIEDVPEEEEELEEQETPEAKRKRIRSENLGECRGICLFFIYLSVFSVGLILDQDVASSQLADHLKFKLSMGHVKIDSVTTPDKLWNYMYLSVLPAIFDTEVTEVARYPDGSQQFMINMENNTDIKYAWTLSKYMHPIDIPNRMIGGVRVRQVRIMEEAECQVSPMFSLYKTNCYPEFNAEFEATSTFGPDGVYEFEGDSTGTTYSGSLGTYGPDGYVQVLSTNISKAYRQLADMQAKGFLDRATRAVFLDFAVWSSWTGTYAILQIVIEFGPASSAAHRTSVLILRETALKVGGFQTDKELIALGLQIVVLVFVLWYLCEEGLEFWSSAREYFTDMWNVLDWVNMIIIIIGFVIRILVWMEASKEELADKAIVNRDEFTNFMGLAKSSELVRLLGAFNAVLLWMKCVKYLRKVPVVKTFLRTIWGSLELFAPFIFMFCIIFIGFVMAFNIGFGDIVLELSTFYDTVVFLIRAYLRDVDIAIAYEELPALTGFMVIVYYIGLVLIAIVVVNAIISDAMLCAKAIPKKKKGEVSDHEDEPVEEVFRVLHEWKIKLVKRCVPKRYWKYFLKKRVEAVEDGGFEGGDDEDDEFDFGGGDDEDYEDEFDYDEEEQDELEQASRKDLLRSIEHMSGRVLSEISIVGIEVKSELHDVCERVAQMQMAVEELSARTEKIIEAQEDMIAKT